MIIERAPILAGTFYPADEQAREEQLAELLGLAQQSEPVFGAIVPHGAFDVSGRIAGEVYARIRVPDVVVVLAASHTGLTTRGSILAHGAYRLPGARIPIDTRFAEELRGLGLLNEDIAPHVHEHAIEIQLPYLLRRNPRLRIVPVVFGPMPHASCVRLGKALADCVNNHGRDILVVASTSLAHYVDAATADALDRVTIDRIEALDGTGLYQHAAQRPEALDSLVPVAILLAAARALGYPRASLVRHGLSGRPDAETSTLVGQAGLVIPAEA